MLAISKPRVHGREPSSRTSARSRSASNCSAASVPNRSPVSEVASRIGLFLDLKLNDIPNTVAGAVRAVARLRPTYVTVHALGGRAMIAAAAQELPDGMIAAVTVLTSLDDADLSEFGFDGSSLDAVRRLAVMSVSAGARAIVCSAREVAAVRAEVGSDVVLITPGVRSAGTDAQDQARVATPEEALAERRRLAGDRSANHRRRRPRRRRCVACGGIAPRFPRFAGLAHWAEATLPG